MAYGLFRPPSDTPSLERSPSPEPLVQPDHFYSPDSDASPGPSTPSSSSRSWTSPDDDPYATKGIPVFKPSMTEFEDFEKYMTRIERWGMHSGIVKVIPPKEWTDALPSIHPRLSSLRIRKPIEQIMFGSTGVFHQQNIEKPKNMSVREWAEMCMGDEYRAPAVHEVGLKSGGENKTYKPKKRKPRRGVVDEEEFIGKQEEDETDWLAGVVTELNGGDTPAGASTPSMQDIEIGQTAAYPRPRRRVKSKEEREALDEDFLETFDPHTAWLPPGTAASDYTPSFCSILERKYWRNCGLGKEPWYGADTAGTLFTDATTSWNVGCLPSALSRLLPKSARGLPGVNTPYLYFGMWRATFAWHVEDMDLFSINYIHFGAPKFWYAIPQNRAVQLENTLGSYFPGDAKKCRQFLRHKSYLASPSKLAASNCRPNTLVQHAGEFVITYPRGYHAGFNLGFNCAESVNFALESWLEIGRKAQYCGCVGDSVRIDVDALLRERDEESAKSEPEVATPEPASATSSGRGQDKRVTKKRKPFEADDSISPKKQKVKAGPSSDVFPSASAQKVFLKVNAEVPFPCCLCVSRDTSSLLRVHARPRAKSGCQNYNPKDASGQVIWRAHETCARIVPETWVDDVQDAHGNIEKVVFGVDAIGKDRWKLICSECSKLKDKNHGAPIQCTKGKCLKAFHVSCARGGRPESRIVFRELREVDKEVLLSEEPSAPPSSQSSDLLSSPIIPSSPQPTFVPYATLAPFELPDPTSREMMNDTDLSEIKLVKKTEYELLCVIHNPTVIAEKKANRSVRQRQELLDMPPMSRIKLRSSNALVEVSLVAVHEERKTVEVLWDERVTKEFSWSAIIWGETGKEIVYKPSVAVNPSPGSGPSFTPNLSVAPFASPSAPKKKRTQKPSPSLNSSQYASTSSLTAPVPAPLTFPSSIISAIAQASGFARHFPSPTTDATTAPPAQSPPPFPAFPFMPMPTLTQTTYMAASMPGSQSQQVQNPQMNNFRVFALPFPMPANFTSTTSTPGISSSSSPSMPASLPSAETQMPVSTSSSSGMSKPVSPAPTPTTTDHTTNAESEKEEKERETSSSSSGISSAPAPSLPLDPLLLETEKGTESGSSSTKTKPERRVEVDVDACTV